ncbi:MAG: DUF1929 domain-containing protein [Acidobacteria bacterium]|nr:DUF1929 domain-containing protein [Acidobacteriota bacterium]MBV9477073.1 DUF1929 domain-containing protein [Acidobacteriota bacterium]
MLWRGIRRLAVVSVFLFAVSSFAGEDITPGCRLPAHTPTTPPKEQVGMWKTVFPAEGSAAIRQILGMQTVHNVMLPSGKILIVSGSSWRNKDLKPTDYWPLNPSPTSPKGAINRADDPFLDSKLADYYKIVNNAAIYDPVDNTFYRIPHPVPVRDPNAAGHFAPDDLFCTGHQHLRDGNVLFAGGTQYYSPFRTGNNSTWIFDWKKELSIDWRRVDWRQIPAAGSTPWNFAGFMERGRWYASLLPLLDGRLAVFSGFVGFDPPKNPDMYQFEINYLVEFFDSSRFDPNNPKAAWRSVDVKSTPNSPFTIEINPTFTPTPGTTSCFPPAPTAEQCVKDNRYDAFKLYPENYLLPDGRIYLTREGDWVSLRTCDTHFMRRTKNTYFARVTGTRDAPGMTFERGPDRAEEITSYGTSLWDPNSNLISILGGQPTSPGVLYPINADEPSHFAGGRGSRKIETFHPSPTDPTGGKWTLEPNFLGDDPNEDRTMHYSIILPTKQVLIINGGNFDFYGPVFDPILLTPQYKAGVFSGYKRELMAAALEPRYYHNSAMLLPDGNIFVSGGNTARATYITRPIPPADPNRVGQPKPDLDSADIDVYFWNDGPMAKTQKGLLTNPTEDWVAEIYSPPYQFIDGDRRAVIDFIYPYPSVPYKTKATIGNREVYLMHSGDVFRAHLGYLPQKCTTDASLALIKLPSATHGWENGQRFMQLPIRSTGDYTIEFAAPNMREANMPPAYYMLFYVDCMGKPSIAKMVRFDNEATEP